MPEPVLTAEKATEIAHTFIKKYYSRAWPLKAVKEGNAWVVEIDVGPLYPKVAKVKISIGTGEVLEYSVPPLVGE